MKNNFNADDFSHLALFAEYGRMIAPSKKDSGASQKPFQDLIFLIRDWQDSAEEAYGWDGGNNVLNE